MLSKPNHPDPDRINDVHLRSHVSKGPCLVRLAMLRTEWYALQDQYGGWIPHTEARGTEDTLTWHYPEECKEFSNKIHLRHK